MALIIERSTRCFQGVNLTPLIDVVFLLIVFFMLSTSFVVSESMELGLPRADDRKNAEETNALADDVMQFRVISDGAIVLDEQRLELDAFQARIAERLAATPSQAFMVFSSPNVTVQQLVSVLDILYMQGALHVQIDHAPGSLIGDDVRLAR